MKDKIITEIQTNMASILSSAQLDELRRVLTNCLYHFDIIEKKPNKQPRNAENRELLEVFISAKRIEGCSEKSLRYYNTAIQQMINGINKPIREILTDDLRVYLADYQKTRGSCRVTIDNMRRIFSSFFGWLEDEDYILKSPVRRIHKVKTEKTIKDTFSDESLELLRDSCEEIRDLAMIDLLASTGMRVGELVRLNREDINFHERECVVFGKFWVNNHAHILQGRNGFTVESLYTLLKQTSVTSIVTGAVQPKINQANLKALPVVVPSAEEMQEFNDLIDPLFAQIRGNSDENLRLAALRDTLLPRLMSASCR